MFRKDEFDRPLKHLLSFLLVVILLLNIPSSNSILVDKEYYSEPLEICTSAYEIHSAIAINSDSSFSTQALAEGWAGNGSASNPYIISGYEIDVSAEAAIRITYTTVHYIIENCIISGQDFGIFLGDAPNGKVKNVICHDSDSHGILAGASPNCTIQDVVCSNNGLGIEIGHCSDVVIDNATCVENGYHGIILYETENVTISESYIASNYYTGINDASGVPNYDCVFYNNTICYNGIGLELNGGNHLVLNNKFVGNGAVDDSTNSQWDDGIGIGNYWFDYSGTGWYQIPGSSGSYDHYPSVYDPPTPIIDSPGDLSKNYNDGGVYLVWHPYDDNPAGYKILQNDSEVVNTTWNGGDVSYLLDGLALGTYSMTLDVWDSANNHVNDSVIVTVDDYKPTIDSPADVSIVEGQEGVTIEWAPFHPHPSNYTILRNDTQIRSGNWSGVPITLSLNNFFPPGFWLVKATAWAESGLSTSDTVEVNVSSVPSLLPQINGPSTQSFTDNETIILDWYIEDSYPVGYAIYRNTTPVESDLCESRNITYTGGPLESGIYNFTIEVWDAYDHNVTAVVWVSIEIANALIIDSPDDIAKNYYDAGIYLVWHPYDDNPAGYRILQNGSEIVNTIWDGGDVSYLLDGLAPGFHIMTLDVWDTEDNHVNDSVTVAVEDDEPTIDSPADVSIVEGQEGVEVEWTPYHPHPLNYSIIRNGTQIRSDSWVGEHIILSLDEYFPTGFWLVTVTVWAESGLAVSDTVAVNVTSIPILPSQIDGPSVLSFKDNESIFLDWYIAYSYPVNYAIYRDTVLIGGGLCESGNITYTWGPLAEGLYNFTLEVWDVYDNRVTKTVWITIESATVTTTTTTTTTGTTETTSSTTNPTTNEEYSALFFGLSVTGAGVGVFCLLALLVKKRGRKEEDSVITPEKDYIDDETPPYPDVEILRGGEFVGNRFRFKVKIINKKGHVITDITTTIVSYPRDSLKLDGDLTKIVPKIDPKGFRSPSFEFLPTQDCVKGNIVASVSYVDHWGKAHSMTTRTYTIRAVCDLLTPEKISLDNFELQLSNFEHGENALRVDELTPEELHSKTLQIIESSNFYEVTDETNQVGEFTNIRIVGWAKGKYTKKNIGVEIIISGRPNEAGSTCNIRMSGEDEAMILPAIDEISQKLSAWLCPRCGGALPMESVGDLKSGKSIACPFCNVTIDR